MLNRLRFALMTMRNQWRLLNTPATREPQPMFDGFRAPALTHLQRERIKAKRYLNERGLA